MTNWQSPRALGIWTMDHCAPHVQMWNDRVTFEWDGESLLSITREAPDGTIAVSTLTWVGEQLVARSRYVEV